MKFKVYAILVIFSLIAFLPQSLFAKKMSSPVSSPFVFVAKAGLDFMGEGEAEFMGESETGDIDNGFSVAGEGMYNFNPVLVGAGVSYLFPRGIDEDIEGKASYVPIYAVLNVPFKLGAITPFLTAQIGYNFFFIDSKYKKEADKVISAELGEDVKMTYTTEGGLYWGIGAGFILDMNLQFEILYTRGESAIKIKNSDLGVNEKMDLTYTKLTLSVGYRF